jgi:hypothetical protein
VSFVRVSGLLPVQLTRSIIHQYIFQLPSDEINNFLLNKKKGDAGTWESGTHQTRKGQAVHREQTLRNIIITYMRSIHELLLVHVMRWLAESYNVVKKKLKATRPCRFGCQQRVSALKVLKTLELVLALAYGSSKHLLPTASSVHLPPSC